MLYDTSRRLSETSDVLTAANERYVCPMISVFNFCDDTLAKQNDPDDNGQHVCVSVLHRRLGFCKPSLRCDLRVFDWACSAREKLYIQLEIRYSYYRRDQLHQVGWIEHLT